MHTVLAYSFDRPVHADRIRTGLECVESFHFNDDSADVESVGFPDNPVGLIAWGTSAESCRWPFVTVRGDRCVVTTNIPLGWHELVGDPPLADVPLELERRIDRDPDCLTGLCPPFSLLSLTRNPSRLFIATDGLGLGALYKLRFDDGWVWSNRLSALFLFVGARPQIDNRGWSFYAASGWFMDDATAMEGAHRLAPGEFVRVGPEREPAPMVQHIHSVAAWVEPRGATMDDADLNHVAENLIATGHHIGGLWDAPVKISLSGGRDSRLVAATMLRAGVNCNFSTNENLRGEGVIARDLLSRLGGTFDHQVFTRATASEDGYLQERVAAWLRFNDGMTSSNKVFTAPPPQSVAVPRIASLTGSAGEIAHGKYYPANLHALRENGEPAVFERLFRKVSWHGGAAAGALDALRQRLDQVISEGKGYGLRNADLLDYFELMERIRRWSGMAARPGNLALLMSPAFLRASFDCQPEAKQNNWLHINLIGRMVPQWRDLPFYRTVKAEKMSQPRAWIWDSDDRPALRSVVSSPRRWDDFFDPKSIKAIWRAVNKGHGQPRHEVVLGRIVWRYFFEDHLQLIRDHIRRVFAASASADWTDNNGC